LFFSNPQGECADLYRFLGVDDTFKPTVLEKRINPRREVRWQSIVWLRHHLRLFLNHEALDPVKSLLTRSNLLDRISEKVVEFNLKQGSFPKLDPQTKNWLITQYERDIIQLERTRTIIVRQLGYLDKKQFVKFEISSYTCPRTQLLIIARSAE